MAKINSRTSLKAIREMAMEDFGVEIDNEQAKDIKFHITKTASAAWTKERYVCVALSPTVKRMSDGFVDSL